MSYLTAHLISDLFLGYNEFSDEDEHIPDVDLVFLNGNIGSLKRSMYFSEILCKKYPDTQFICNLGETELYSYNIPTRSLQELREQCIKRQTYNDTWPKNLHYNYNDNMIIECRGGKKIDILTLYGFPKILTSSVPWEETSWYRYYFKDLIYEDIPVKNPFKPEDTSNVNHGVAIIPADLNFINELHEAEWKRAKKWEITNNGYYKILVTHINPVNDSRLSKQKYRPFDIHLDSTGTWLSTNVEQTGIKFIGGRLFSNPGRGIDKRNKVIPIG